MLVNQDIMHISKKCCVDRNSFLAFFRYADRAKKIKNKAVVNENPMDKLIRELREENEKLKKFLDGGGVPAQDVGGGGKTLSSEGEYICRGGENSDGTMGPKKNFLVSRKK